MPLRRLFIRAKAGGIGRRFVGVFAPPALQIPLRRGLAPRQRRPKQGDNGDPARAAMMLRCLQHLPSAQPPHAPRRGEARRRRYVDVGRSRRGSTKLAGPRAARAQPWGEGPERRRGTVNPLAMPWQLRVRLPHHARLDLGIDSGSAAQRLDLMRLALGAERIELAVGLLAIAIADAGEAINQLPDEAGREIAGVNVGTTLGDIEP